MSWTEGRQVAFCGVVRVSRVTRVMWCWEGLMRAPEELDQSPGACQPRDLFHAV